MLQNFGNSLKHTTFTDEIPPQGMVNKKHFNF